MTDEAPEPSVWRKNRVLIIVGAVLAALLVAVIVALSVVVGTLNAQEKQRAYEACMARSGFAVDEQAPPVSDDDLDQYVDALVAAAEACSKD